MLRHEELAFIEDVGSMEVSPVLLRELRKALATITPTHCQQFRHVLASCKHRPSCLCRGGHQKKKKLLT
jgi:hypothetical protein